MRLRVHESSTKQRQKSVGLNLILLTLISFRLHRYTVIQQITDVKAKFHLPDEPYWRAQPFGEVDFQRQRCRLHFAIETVAILDLKTDSKLQSTVKKRPHSGHLVFHQIVLKP